MNDYHSDKRAVVEEGAKIGSGSSIWHFSHLRSGCTVGENCIIGKGVYVDIGVTIGNNCKIQNGVSIYNGVKIDSEVFIGPHAVFTNDLRPRAGIWDENRLTSTIVHRGASIGANATIRCGIEIGAWSMIAAGSVVTKTVPPHALVVGVPGRIAGWVSKNGDKLEISVDEGLKGGTFKCKATGEEIILAKLEE